MTRKSLKYNESERNEVSLILRLRLPGSLIVLTGGETIYTIEDGMKMIVRETIYIVINE